MCEGNCPADTTVSGERGGGGVAGGAGIHRPPVEHLMPEQEVPEGG